jgi:hypothetical protein
MATGRVDIIGSNMNLSPVQAATWGITQHIEAFKYAGYTGMEYFPLRGRMGAELLAGKGTAGFMEAGHEPWREINALQIVGIAVRGLATMSPRAAKAAALEVAINASMPRREQADRTLRRIARCAGSAVAIVVHPHGQLLGDNKGSRHRARDYGALRTDPAVSALQWQPTAEFAAARGVLTSDSEATAQRMVEVALADGLGRIQREQAADAKGTTPHAAAAFDTNHADMTRQGGHRFTDPEAIAAWLARNGHLDVLEFSLQPRFGGDINDLRKIMEGDVGETPQGRMLAAAASNTPPGEDFHIKVQIPDYAFTGSPEEQGLGMDKALDGHKLLVPIITEYAVNNLPAAA